MNNRYTAKETTSPTGRPRFTIRGRRPNGVPGAKQINSTITAKKGQSRGDVKTIADEKIRELLLEDAQFQTMRKPKPTVLTSEQIEDAEFATRLLAQKGIDSKLSEIVELGIDQWRPSEVPAILSKCKLLYYAWREKMGFDDDGSGSSSIGSVIGRFEKFLGGGCDLNSVTPKIVAEFFQSPFFKNERQYQQAVLLRAFFNFLVKRPDQMSDVRQSLMGSNPAEEVAKEMKVLYRKPTKTRIWSIEQVERNLKLAEEYCGGEGAAYMALTLFAGIRPCVVRGEITKVEAIDYNSATRSIELDATKTKIPRQIDVSDNLAIWLDVYGMDNVMPSWGHRSTRWKGFRKKCEWSHDVTRHTCISYWLQHHKKQEHRAIYMFGNGDRIRNQHYRRKVTDEDAVRFWNIVPNKAKGSVAIKFPA